MTLRALLAATLLAALAACQSVKGPSESGLPVYYAPGPTLGSHGTVYPPP